MTSSTEVDDGTARAIGDGLDAYNATQVPGDWKMLWIVGRDEADTAQCGIKAVTAYDWLFVGWLWVGEAYRRRGMGSRLLRDAESVARERGCASSYLDTFSFQAPEFYKRHGYTEFGRLENFPPGHQRIWFRKTL